MHLYMELMYKIYEARCFLGLQIAKEALLTRQAEESRCWDVLRFEEAMAKVQHHYSLTGELIHCRTLYDCTPRIFFFHSAC